MTKIYIIGAGPVGLWTAIQIKSQQPEVEIKIVEKYAEYKRKHPLRLELNALNSIAIPSHAKYKDAIEKMKTNIINKGNEKWNIVSGKYINIRTNDLEKELKDTALRLGVEITNQDFTSIDTLPTDVDYIIGADGAHSKVRKIVCDNEENNTDRKTLQYVVEVKYEATPTEEGKNKIELKSLKTKYPTQKLMHFFTDDYVGKPNADNKYPVSVRFFVDKDTYDGLGDAGFKSPQGIKDVKNLPEKLRQDMAIWLNARKKYGENIEDSKTIKITKLPLEVYKSTNFAKVYNNKFIGICGDAAGAYHILEL